MAAESFPFLDSDVPVAVAAAATIAFESSTETDAGMAHMFAPTELQSEYAKLVADCRSDSAVQF